MRAWKLWVVAFLAMWTSSCFEAMRWESQDIHLKYDAETDTARVLLVYEGVFAGKSEGEEFETAVKAVKAIAAKKRYFALIDWPFEVDLDGSVRDTDFQSVIEVTTATDPNSPKLTLLKLLSGIEVTDAHVFVDEHTKLVVVQELRLPRFSKFIAAGNAWFSQETAADEGPGPNFTAAEWATWRAKAAKGTPWGNVTSTAMEFRAPYGPRWLAQAIKELAAGEPFGPGIVGALSEIAVENGEVVFRALADESKTFHFHFGPPHGEPHEFDAELAARLEEDGMEFQREQIESYAERFQR